MTDTEAGNFGRGSTALLRRPDFQTLLDVLADRGYSILGPTVRDGAVVYDEVRRVEDLPIGLRDEQDGGHYRLGSGSDVALFGYTNGVQAWRRHFFPPEHRILRAERTAAGFTIQAEETDAEKVALLGARPCEIWATEIQDKVFIHSAYRNPAYAARRANAFIVAVNCGSAGGTCFCASMGTGPLADHGFDLALTELLDRERHAFVVEVGSDLGLEVAHALPLRPADEGDRRQAEEIIARTTGSMGRHVETGGLKELLQGNLEHPRWREVAERCLACGNCTLVCPTCFCFTVDDATDLTGRTAERVQRWESCFTLGHSYIHGGSVRRDIGSRYRQWMTHKLAHWLDQFGVSGCVGCGRCITWCPVGIDITEEAAAIRAEDRRQ